MYYVLQVETGKETQCIARVNLPSSSGCKLHFPKRLLKIRKQGKTKKQLAPIFPGYVFLEVPETLSDLDTVCRNHLRRVPGVFRFLPSNAEPKPLAGADIELLKTLLSCGEYVGTSFVYFDTNDRIRVMSGPLKNFEGDIIRVDKRKGRALIMLHMQNKSFKAYLSFDDINRVT